MNLSKDLKLNMLMKYCEMNSSAKNIMGYFKNSRKRRTVKPVIKKRIFERHYIKDAVFVNPNFENMVDRISQINSSSALKLKNYFESMMLSR